MILQIGAVGVLVVFALVAAYAMILDVGFLGFLTIIGATALVAGSVFVLAGSL